MEGNWDFGGFGGEGLEDVESEGEGKERAVARVERRRRGREEYRFGEGMVLR